MRFLWFLLAVLCVDSAFAANDLSDCAGIEDAAARLKCYDRIARPERDANAVQPAAEAPAAVDDHARREPTQGSSPPAVREATPVVETAKSSRSDDGIDHTDRSETGDALFGLERQLKPGAEIDQIDARIQSVRKTPLGQHVISLSNGQAWMENEPGRRPIEAGQEVTIRKHRWYYEMVLKAQPNVAVHRID